MTLEYWFTQINNVVDGFIKTFNTDYNCAVGSDFCTVIEDERIEWTLVYVEKGGKSFYENFVSRFPNADGFNLFTLSVLHELGHLETQDEMEDDVEKRATIANDEEYYALYNETIATDWAGSWINAHYEDAIIIDTLFTTVIEKCYSDLITE
jgi:hypothetical protein